MSGGKSFALPAYAREIAAARKEGKVPSTGEVVVALDVWRWGKPQGNFIARCLVAEDRAIDSVDFGFLAGLDVIGVFSSAVSDGARVRALARALLATQPRRLLLADLNPDVGRLYWIRSEGRGQEVQP